MPKNEPLLKLSADAKKLIRLYDGIEDHLDNYLDKLEAAFERRCDEIRDKTQAKLDQVPESDTEMREKILAEEQKLVDKILQELNYAINEGDRRARAKLEIIQGKLDIASVDLESELAQIK